MLSTLRAIIQTVNAADSLQETFEIIAKQINRAIKSDSSSVFLRDTDKQSYSLAANHGLSATQQKAYNIVTQSSIEALINRQENKDSNAKFGAIEFLMAVPIIHHRKILGILLIQNNPEKKQTFSEDSEAFLITLSAQLAGIIANAELENIFRTSKRRKNPTQFKSLSSTPGLAKGKGWIISPPASFSSIPERSCADPKTEIKHLRKALGQARKDIRKLARSLSNRLAKQEQVLFTAYEQMLSHASLGKKIENIIKRDNIWAPSALRIVIDDNVKRFSSMEDPYLKERATDILDLGRRVLSHLQEQEPSLRSFPRKTILISEQVTSAMIAEVPVKQLVGIISMKGSSTSHAAILARSLGIPALMGLRNCPIQLLEGKLLILDGYKKFVYVKPGRALLKEFKILRTGEQQMLDDLQVKTKRNSSSVTKTKDGVTIQLMINTGMLIGAEQNTNIHADGVGLFRSEYPFMQSQRFPSENEQKRIYGDLLAAYEGKPVVIRTLDIGGDKSLPYFPIEEENPFLGWRGIRITLDHPEIFKVQIRAMLLSNHQRGNLHISLPMIATLSELDESIIQIRIIHDQLKTEFGYSDQELPFPKIGVVIEVPSAVYQIRAITKRVDFISIGTNDLTQYMFAVDRNNTKVSYLYDSLHPAILLALTEVCEASNNENIPVHICGEIAANPLATLVLLSMGVSALSMNIHSIPKVRKIIQCFKMKDAEKILSKALSYETTFKVREYMMSELQKRGLDDLVIPGNH